MIEQGSEEWREQRRGKITASEAYCLLAKGTKASLFSAGANTYKNRLIAERLGCCLKEVKAHALEHGKTFEPEARREYQIKTGNVVFTAEFMEHPDYPFFGASPDGFIREDNDLFGDIKKITEIKCPSEAENHIAHIMGYLPEKYYVQMQSNMLVLKVDCCDFISYYPGLGENSLFIREVKADMALIPQLLKRAILFEREINAGIEFIKKQGVYYASTN